MWAQSAPPCVQQKRWLCILVLGGAHVRKGLSRMAKLINRTPWDKNCMCVCVYTQQQQLFDIRRVHVHKFIYCVLARAKRVTRPTGRFYWIAEKRGRESDLLLQILDFRCINPHKFLGALIFYAPHRFICMRMAAPRTKRCKKGSQICKFRPPLYYCVTMRAAAQSDRKRYQCC